MNKSGKHEFHQEMVLSGTASSGVTTQELSKMDDTIHLFIDGDDTLFHKTMLPPGQSVHSDPHAFTSLGTNLRAQARPSARAFIRHFRNKGVIVSCLTGGHSDEQKLALSRARLSIDNVFGFDNRNEMPPLPRHWLLVDDLPPNERDLCGKFARILGISDLALSRAEFEKAIAENFVKCRPFCGIDDREPLTDLIPIVSQKLGLS